VHTEASSSRIMRRLTTLFPSEFLEEHAEELGVVEREGKLQIPVLVWALVRLRRRREPNTRWLPTQLQLDS
jgi:putative transposase